MPRRKGGDTPGARLGEAKRAARKPTGAPAKGKAPEPRPKAVTVAQKAQRDELMMARLMQGWTIPMVAQEAGISERTAERAIAKRRAAGPLNLRMDPVRLVEGVFEQLQASIGGFEAIAADALAKDNLAVAVGAKRSANDARGKIMEFLQMTGRLPEDLSRLRHLIDLRTIAVQMLDAMDSFEREMALVLRLDGADERREASEAALRQVRTTFSDLVGINDESAEEDVEGTAREIEA